MAPLDGEPLEGLVFFQMFRVHIYPANQHLVLVCLETSKPRRNFVANVGRLQVSRPENICRILLRFIFVTFTVTGKDSLLPKVSQKSERASSHSFT